MDDRSADSFVEILRRGSPDLLTVRSVEGTILFVSDAVSRILGVSPADFVGTNAFHHVHPDDLVQVREEQANGTHNSAVEHRLRNADGEWVWVETHTRRQVEAGDQSEFIVGVTRDISDRVALEKQLNRKKVLREAAAAVSPLAIIALGEAGEVLSCMGALFGMEGGAAFTGLREQNRSVADACSLALSGTNSSFEVIWQDQPVESRFISLVGHSVGAIQAICLFLPRPDSTNGSPEFTRH